MQTIKKHKRPGIVPGMLLSTRFFDQLLKWMNSLVADGLRALTRGPYYGMISSDKPSQGETNPRLFIEGDSIILTDCEALTAVGSLIAVLEEHCLPLQLPLESISWDGPSDLFIFPVQDWLPSEAAVATKETPLMHELTLPAYRLEARPSGEIQGTGDFLKVGRLERSPEGEHRLVPFLPACLQLNAHHLLLKRYNRYYQVLFQNVYPTTLQVICNYRLEERQKRLYGDLVQLCKDLRQYLSREHFRYREILPDTHPSAFFDCCIGFATSFHDSLEFLRGKFHPAVERLSSREEVLRYLEYRCRRSPGRHFISIGAFENTLEKVIRLSYTQEDLLPGLELLDNFMEQVDDIFHTLGQVDQFLGQPEDQPIHHPLKQQAPGGLWK